MKTNYTSETPCFSTHKKEKATRNRQQKIKNVFFTHNKEKATGKSLQGVKSDENKLNISKTPCFSTHKEEKSLQGAESE